MIKKQLFRLCGMLIVGLSVIFFSFFSLLLYMNHESFYLNLCVWIFFLIFWNIGWAVYDYAMEIIE